MQIAAVRASLIAALLGCTDAFVVAPQRHLAPQQQQLGGAAHSLMHSRRRIAAEVVMEQADDPEHEAKVDKALKAMVMFSNSYCKNTDTRYCSDPSIPAVVIKGLA